MAGDGIDIVLETPGGLGEAVEYIVRIVREKYERVGVIVPGCAKSAGTILAMAGDEILMGRASSLGPIDGQVQAAGGMRLSAGALLEGIAKIKSEAERAGRLTPAYIPILQNITPGEIQDCKDMQAHSRRLAAEWLAEYNFKSRNRRGGGRAAAAEERRRRADEAASALCSRSRWLTRDRSIKIRDLEKLGVNAVSYDDRAELSDAIARYYALLRISFEVSFAYKIFETPSSQTCRFLGPGGAARPQQRPRADKSRADAACPKRQATPAAQASWTKCAASDSGADPPACPARSARIPPRKMPPGLKAVAGQEAAPRMQGRREAYLECVDGAIRARPERRPPRGGAPHPADAPGAAWTGTLTGGHWPRRACRSARRPRRCV